MNQLAAAGGHLLNVDPALIDAETPPGFLRLTLANDINGFGQIVGTGSYYDGNTIAERGYILTVPAISSIPEPACFTALAGLTALGLCSTRRRRKAV